MVAGILRDGMSPAWPGPWFVRFARQRAWLQRLGSASSKQSERRWKQTRPRAGSLRISPARGRRRRPRLSGFTESSQPHSAFVRPDEELIVALRNVREPLAYVCGRVYSRLHFVAVEIPAGRAVCQPPRHSARSDLALFVQRGALPQTARAIDLLRWDPKAELSKPAVRKALAVYQTSDVWRVGRAKIASETTPREDFGHLSLPVHSGSEAKRYPSFRMVRSGYEGIVVGTGSFEERGGIKGSMPEWLTVLEGVLQPWLK
jgi:hypothetical protein